MRSHRDPCPELVPMLGKNHRLVLHIGNCYLNKYTTTLASQTWSRQFPNMFNLFLYSTIITCVYIYMLCFFQIYRLHFSPTFPPPPGIRQAQPRYDKPLRHPQHQSWWRKHQDSVAQVSPDPVAILGFLKKKRIQDVGAWNFCQWEFIGKKCEIKKKQTRFFIGQMFRMFS